MVVSTQPLHTHRLERIGTDRRPVSTRLTGGPANSNCLSALESGGMGEGWGDFMGAALRLKPSDTRDASYAAGDWVTGNPKGIRKYLYSTSLETNPPELLGPRHPGQGARHRDRLGDDAVRGAVELD